MVVFDFSFLPSTVQAQSNRNCFSSTNLEEHMTDSTQSGLSDNAAGALAYVTIIPAIIFLVIEPYNKNAFIKFHCWQSIFLCIACIAIDMILFFIPFVGWIIVPLFGLGVLILWIICVMKAFQGQKFMFPVIGGFAEKQANS
jgi:uncharacterized membrane protein